MLAKNQRKFRLINKYKQDFSGKIASKGFRKKWSTKTKTFKVFYKNIKIVEKRIKPKYKKIVERKKRRFERKKEYDLWALRDRLKKKYGLTSFYYRVDIIKLTPRKKKITHFGRKLKERHKLRSYTSNLNVKKFKSYLKKASNSAFFEKTFFKGMESRFDVFLYRLNFFSSSSTGRQLINHGNFLVNNKINIFPSYTVKLNDIVSVVDKKLFFNIFKNRLKQVIEYVKYKKWMFFYLRDWSRKEQTDPKGRYYYTVRSKKLVFLGEVFFSIPSYMEVNYRILSGVFVFYPSSKFIFYPFKINNYLFLSKKFA